MYWHSKKNTVVAKWLSMWNLPWACDPIHAVLLKMCEHTCAQTHTNVKLTKNKLCEYFTNIRFLILILSKTL